MSGPKQITLLSPHQNGCILNRALLPARFCQQYLENVKLVPQKHLSESTKGDVLVIHGMPIPEAPAKYERWMRSGTKVIASLDDDLRCLPDWNPVKEALKPDQFGALDYVTRNVSGLLLSTDPLAESMPKNDGHPVIPNWVCPNLIDPGMYRMNPRKANRTLRILWAGSNTHHGDQEEIIESVTDVLSMYSDRVEFIFWGECHPEIARRHLYRGVNMMPIGELGDYFAYLPNIAPDIWLCPLADIKFNQSKSNLKVLEGWACQAAVIASPTYPYAKTVNHGTDGWLARTRVEWTNSITALIDDPKLMLSFQQAGYQKMMDQYNWQKKECVEPWLRFFRALSA